MTHKLIKTYNYLLVFADSKARVEYYLHGIDDIIAHLPLNGSPVLEGVPLLPPLEDEVKPDPKLIDSMSMRYRHDFGLLDKQHQDSIRTTMIQLWEEVVGKGFYKAKEKYKYTEEQVREVIGKAQLLNHNNEFVFTEEYLIESLQQPKYPIAFECEMQEYVRDMPNIHSKYYLPKTTTNSQGQTEWVGKYIY